jgi:hypothetical protein
VSREGCGTEDNARHAGLRGEGRKEEEKEAAYRREGAVRHRGGGRA